MTIKLPTDGGRSTSLKALREGKADASLDRKLGRAGSGHSGQERSPNKFGKSLGQSTPARCNVGRGTLTGWDGGRRSRRSQGGRGQRKMLGIWRTWEGKRRESSTPVPPREAPCRDPQGGTARGQRLGKRRLARIARPGQAAEQARGTGWRSLPAAPLCAQEAGPGRTRWTAKTPDRYPALLCKPGRVGARTGRIAYSEPFPGTSGVLLGAACLARRGVGGEKEKRRGSVLKDWEFSRAQKIPLNSLTRKMRKLWAVQTDLS